MKKIINFVLLVNLLLLASCNFEVPEKITVKSNASYQFNVGDVKKDLGETVNFDNLINGDAIKTAIPNAQVYNYFPNEKDAHIQKFLIKLPLIEIPIDIGQYFNNSSLSSAIQGISFEKEIVIPSVTIEKNVEIELSELNKLFNETFSFVGLTADKGTPNFVCNFTSIDYSSISIEITGEGADTIADGTEVTISNGIKEKKGTFSGNKALIDFTDGLSFTKSNLEIHFSGDFDKQYVGKINSESKIKKVIGITSTDFSFPTPLSTTVEVPNVFETATVEEGTLTTTVNCPSWQGTTISYGIETTGVLTLTETKSSKQIKKVSLDTKTLSPGEINVTVPLEIGFDNATIDFTKNPIIAIATNIKSFSEVTVKTPEVTTSLENEQEFPSEVRDAICGMVLESSGIKGTYTNTFPTGNDITLIADSDFFSIDNESCTLESGKINANFNLMSGEATKEITIVNLASHDPAVNNFGKWDFDIKIELPGEVGDEITVKNVKPNQTYKIGINVTPELNWESVKVKVPTLDKSDKQSLGINFSELFKPISETLGISDFASKINLKSIPIYLHAEKPSNITTFNTLSVQANVALFYSNDGTTPISDAEGVVQKEIIGNSGVKETLNFVNGIPEYKMKNNSLITNIGNYPSSANCDIADFLNRTLTLESGSLCINYAISLNATDEITVTKEECENLSTGAIAVTAFIVLPFQFIVASPTESIEVDLTSVIKKSMGGGSDIDLFGRTSATQIIPPEVTLYTGIIQSCGLIYKTNGFPIYSNQPIEVKIKMTSSGEPKTLNIDGDKMIVRSDDINQIFSQDSYPYMPELSVTIPASTEFSLKRTLDFDVNLSLIANTDGSFPLLGGKS